MDKNDRDFLDGVVGEMTTKAIEALEEHANLKTFLVRDLLMATGYSVSELAPDQAANIAPGLPTPLLLFRLAGWRRVGSAAIADEEYVVFSSLEIAHLLHIAEETMSRFWTPEQLGEYVTYRQQLADSDHVVVEPADRDPDPCECTGCMAVGEPADRDECVGAPECGHATEPYEGYHAGPFPTDRDAHPDATPTF